MARHQTWILPVFLYDFPWPLLLYSSNSRRHHVRISQPSFMPHILIQLIPGHNQPPQCTRQYFPHSSVTASPGGNPLGAPRPLFPPQVVPERRALRRCTWSPEHPPVLVPRAADGFLARLWHVSQVVVISPAHQPIVSMPDSLHDPPRVLPGVTPRISVVSSPRSNPAYISVVTPKALISVKTS